MFNKLLILLSFGYSSLGMLDVFSTYQNSKTLNPVIATSIPIFSDFQWDPNFNITESTLVDLYKDRQVEFQITIYICNTTNLI